jgi:hypothetical protein
MDITQAYALAVGGTFSIPLLANLLPYIKPSVTHFISNHLTCPFLLHRHRLFGPWSRAEALVQLIYLTVNVFCLSFRVLDFSKAGVRAGTLSLVNMIPLFAGPHFGFLTDMLGVPLKVYRHAHQSAALMSFLLLSVHVLSVVSRREPFMLGPPQHLFTVIVSLLDDSIPFHD